jgi:hypothetical protein
MWIACAATVAPLFVSTAAAQTLVDVELVIAVDVSLSMDLDEQQLQREGYVTALRDPEIHKAITSGAHGRIAITYLEWAGPPTQNVVVPWTVVDGAAAAQALADRLQSLPISRARMTSITAALGFAAGLFEHSGVKGVRRVIDVSGDGPNNAGGPLPAMREAVLAKGIVINGLPIMLKLAQPGFFDLGNLDRYYADCVIGGAGSFMVAVKDASELKAAIRRKLLLEIAGLEPLRIVPVQEGPPVDCLIGEKQWQWYLDRGAPN